MDIHTNDTQTMSDLYGIAKLLIIVLIVIVVLYLIVHFVLAIFAIAPYGIEHIQTPLLSLRPLIS